MKHLLTSIGLLTVLIIAGCTKDVSHPAYNNNVNPQSDSIIRFLNKEIPGDISKLDLKSIKRITYKAETIGFQIFEKSTTKKFLLLRKELNNYLGNWVDLSKIIKTNSAKYSGKIVLTKLNSENYSELIIVKNKLSRIDRKVKNSENSLQFDPNQNGTPSLKSHNFSRSGGYITLPEVIIYMPDGNNYYNLYWLFDRDDHYENHFIKDEEEEELTDEGSGSPSENRQTTEVIILPVFTGPDHPIKDLLEELKCFTIITNSTYSISINVNQPNPNSRDKVNWDQHFMAGHAYLSFEQTNADGSKIVRNIGFYPEGTVFPGAVQDVSVYGDDSNTPFSVSLKIGVTGTELNTVINTLLNQQTRTYELDNFNCVNQAAAALGSIKVNIPLTESGFPFVYKGANPADLGQDIRKLDLKKYSEENGNRHITKYSVGANNQMPVSKTGSC